MRAGLMRGHGWGAAVALLTLNACGGGGSSAPSAPNAPTADGLVGTHWTVAPAPGWFENPGRLGNTAMTVSFEGPCGTAGGFCSRPGIQAGQQVMFFRTHYLLAGVPTTSLCVGDSAYAWFPAGSAFRMEFRSALGTHAVGDGRLMGDQMEITVRRPPELAGSGFPCRDVCVFTGRRAAAPLEFFSSCRLPS